MGWADCGTDDLGRPIGYAFEAVCDHEGCDKEIHRGLAYVCGGMHSGGEHGCGMYFCYSHLDISGPEQLCPECYRLWELGESDA